MKVALDDSFYFATVEDEDGFELDELDVKGHDWMGFLRSLLTEKQFMEYFDDKRVFKVSLKRLNAAKEFTVQ